MNRAAGGRGDQRLCRYKGVRRRRWGKWVSEIRVPGTRERLWLGSYATAEAAAVAHDAAVYLLRRGGGAGGLNFPGRAAAAYGYVHGARGASQLSPRSVQRASSDAGMAADAQLVELRERPPEPGQDGAGVGVVVAQGGGAGARDQQDAYSNSDDTYWCTYGDGSRSSCSTGSEQLVYGDLSVDDLEILM